MYIDETMDSESRCIVPDSILENLTCQICCKYLTVCPIGVHPEGGNICGRCLYEKRPPPECLFECDSSNLSLEGFIPLVLLAYASYPKSLFPCVNRFDGCRELLPFSDISNHEKSCVYKMLQCPLCQFQGVGSQLVQHFRRFHKKCLLSDDSIFALQLDKDCSEIYLYRSGCFLFFVHVQYIKDICQFIIETLCLGIAGTTKLGRLKILFRIPLDSVSPYSEYVLVSDNIEIARNCRFNLTFKIVDFHLSESKKVLCQYNLIIPE